MIIHIPFEKYEGAGNDFVILSGEAVSCVPRDGEGNLQPVLVRRLCDRHFGIGADGVIELHPSASSQCHASMRYYNADGLPAAMCGNGARCALRCATRLGLVADFGTLETPAGSVSGCGLDPDWSWIILPDVPSPRFDAASSGWLIDTGVPHLVVETDRLDDAHLMRCAEELRWRVEPAGANVDYYSVVDGAVYSRTYERGVESETLACGTGAVAVALIASKRHRGVGSPVTVHQRGGTLRVHFEAEYDPYRWYLVRLFGPARAVFRGSMSIDLATLTF